MIREDRIRVSGGYRKVNRKSKPLSNAKIIEAELKDVIRPDKAEFLPGFFQAYPGGYGEGDQFLGVVVPDTRRIARAHRQAELTEIKKLLGSKWHECRLAGLYILVDQFERGCKRLDQPAKKPAADGRDPLPRPAEIVKFYLSNLSGVNNWDLVDSSAHKILGEWILRHPAEEKILLRLAKSKVLWEQRISVIATLPLIKQRNFDILLRLAQRFLSHRHDLMNKAVGWMLREAGKQDVEVLRAFLLEHVSEMPRTMLRYSIEKLDAAERKRWLSA